MRNEAICDLDDGNSDSDDDSDCDTDDEIDEDDDDNYDDLIAGVNAPNNADLPDPPDENENVDEHQHNEDDDDEDEEDDGDNDGNEEQEQAEAEEPTIISASLKKLADTDGELPPILNSRTRQQAQNNSETLVTGTTAEEWKQVQPLTKKNRKLERELQKQILKRYKEESKKRLRNKLKNEKRKTKARTKKKAITEIRDERGSSDRYGAVDYRHLTLRTH